ncbi:MAG: molybdopterin-dependent oxidoreductase [Calditrichia bacterium]
MKLIHFATGFLLGAVLSIPLIFLSYLGNYFFAIPFAPFDLFDYLARILPARISSFFIDLMIAVIRGLHLGPTAGTAKFAEQIVSLILFILIAGILGIILTAFFSKKDWNKSISTGFLAGVLWFIAFLFIESGLGNLQQKPTTKILWLFVIFALWGFVLGLSLLQIFGTGRAETAGFSRVRRTFLYLGGTSIVAIIIGAFAGVNVLLSRRKAESVPEEVSTLIDPSQTSGPAASPPLKVLEQRIPPAPGTRLEVTTNRDFYRVDINTGLPPVDENTWRLKIDGLVDTPLNLTMAEVKSMPAIAQYITLSCISNPVGGDLISTAMVRGVPLKEMLKRAGVKPEANWAFIESVDGFYESVSPQAIEDERTILVFEMNGKSLPPAHGFPLRIYIPDLYGMKQPKWIIHIRAIAKPDSAHFGFWEDNGWSKQAVARTTSVIDTVDEKTAEPGADLIPIGGIAWAGGRGISKVEIQIDDGPWVQAELRDPPLSPLTWVQWRYNYPPKKGKHIARVRAYDGDGKLQILKSESSFPDGASGIDTYSFQI